MAIGRWRRFRRFVTYLAIRAFLAVLRLPPLGLARALGAALGRMVHALARGERRRSLEHLTLALPELDPARRRAIARGCFAHLGRSAAEVAQIDRIRRRFDHWVVFPDDERRVLEDALAEGRGVLVVSGHLGNWELLGFYLAWRGYPVRTLARALKDSRLDAFVRRYRESRGVRTILRGEPGAPKAMLQAFRDGDILGFFLDQDTDVPGVFAPFLGELAWTPRGAAVLALRMGAPVVVATVARLPDGRHRLTVERCEVAGDRDREEDVVRVTTGLNEVLGRRIRETPEQWVWMHRRWRRRPLQPPGNQA